MTFSKERWGRLILWGIGVIGVVVALWQIGLQGWYFLQPSAVVWDTGIYLAMGRALLNGFTLYSDLFDLKPPGVFLLSAASLGVFGDARLGNMFGAFALIAFPLAFFLVVWPVIRLENREKRITLALLAILLGAFWSLFQAIEGGPWQTEPFGAVFALLYVCSLFALQRGRMLRMLLLSIGLLGSIGMKEPFFLSCAAAALFVSETPRDFLKNYVVPLLLALAAGACIMALLGILTPYLTFYLPSVLEYRGRAFGPLWMRAFGIGKLFVNFGKVSPVAPVTLVLVMVFGITLRHRDFRTHVSKQRWKILSTVLGLYLAFLSFGVAGDYQAHHFVFLAPAFFALCFIILQNASAAWNERWVRIACSVLLVTVTLVFLLPTHLPDPRYPQAKYQEKLTAAENLDAMLSACGIDQYMTVLGTEINVHGFTKHSPMNHSIFWQIDSAIQYGQTFLDLSIDRLSRVQVIVVPRGGFTSTNDIGRRMAAYIIDSFSLTRPSCAASLPDLPGHAVLFRTKNEPLDLQIEFIDERE